MKQETTFIYSLEFPEGNVRYIGKANRPKERFWQHISKAKLGDKSYKYSWIRSLLKNNNRPILKIVDEVPIKEWGFWEQHYISLYKSWEFKLTNLFEGGVGCEHTEETRKRIGEGNRGKVRSEKHRLAVAKANSERVWSEKSKEKLSKASRGRKMPEGFAEAVVERLTGVKHSEERKMNQRIASANMEIVKCPYCNESGKLNIMNQFHFDKCKQNPNYKPKEYICEYCGKITTHKSSFTKYHNNNCSKNPNNSRETIKCPHCDVESINKTNMSRYHFDNCKHKK